MLGYTSLDGSLAFLFDKPTKKVYNTPTLEGSKIYAQLFFLQPIGNKTPNASTFL